jgi:outer membrane protein
MKRLVAALSALIVVTIADAKDLSGVYQDALMYDSQIREADATRKASKEANPQAWAALLPQLNGNYQISRQQQEQKSAQAFPDATGALRPFPFNVDSFATNHGYQLQLSQSIFSYAKWASVARAHKQVAQAEVDYRAAQENLIVRVAQAYFNVLSALDTLDAQAAALEAISRQLDQANKRFEVGLIAITDVKEAQAARDSAAAQVIDAKRQLASNQQALREITNQEYESLSKPGEDMPLRNPEPADPERWVSVSMDQNLSLVSSRLGADVARDAVEINRGGHFPSIDLTGAKQESRGDVDETLSFGGPPGTIKFPQIQSGNSVGLQFTVPIFSGGLVSSQVRQAQYSWIAAKERVTTVSRQTEHQARDAYSGVVSEVARVNALKQGLESAQTALKATEAGDEVGTRTAVEVLTSRQNLVQAQTNYAQARYQYILDIIQLRLAAGTLDGQGVTEINQWLTAVQAMPTSPVTQPTPPVPPQP